MRANHLEPVFVGDFLVGWDPIVLCRRDRLGITQGSVGVSTVSNTQHHDFVLLIVDAEHDSKRATARGPKSVKVAV